MSLAERVRTPSHRRTVAERAEAGKAARAATPRASHSELELDAGRDPVGQIESEGVGRLEELLPIRHARMRQSTLAFYRGTASLMARDLSTTPTTGLVVQLCGDAHLSNFGVFASPDRHLVFDLNDFDETARGPFEWDVKRLAASFVLTAQHQGLPAEAGRDLVLESVGWYRRAMREFAELSNLGVWYSRADADRIGRMLDALRGTRSGHALAQTAAKARAKDHTRALERLTEVVDGRLRIVSKPPLVIPLEEFAPADSDRDEIEALIRELLQRYRRTLANDRRALFDQYHYVHLAHKVVGVGSVGTRCWMVLLLGRDDTDALVLQVKEASGSVLEPYVGRSPFANDGQRVVEGQRLMQASSDIFLGWLRNRAGFDGNVRDFYVRQLWDWKGSIDVETIALDALKGYARLCGWTLARAHARSGDRIGIASYLGKGDTFDRAIAAFADAYAEVAVADHASFAQAIESGRLPVGEA